MVEEQIEVKRLVSYFKQHLAPDEGKPATQLQQQIAQVQQESALDLTLARSRSQRQEVKLVGVFENLLRKVGVGRRKRPLEVGERLPLSLMQPAGDLMHGDVPAPTVLDGSAQIPLASLRIFEPVQQDPEMAPRQKCHKLWHFFQNQAKPRLSFACTSGCAD